LDRLPIAIGVCEVENDWVLRQLCLNTPLRRFDYDYVHCDSPDRRGIDVALLYRKSLFEVLYYESIPVLDSTDSSFKTRDILLVKGVIKDMDTVFLLMNHFPSKRLGYEAYEKRLLAATVLYNTLDTIMQRYSDSKIIVMGDFNDTPFDACMTKVLKVSPHKKDWETNTLINLMADISLEKGTYKYQAVWSCIDQILITKNLHPNYSTSIEVVNGVANIYEANFLLIPDNKFLGFKLYRTYTGPKYNGGFSDHLPIYIDIQKN
jgi:endonuclease/exonuclease/phosphatase family metal-dependent hydrolase